MSEPDEKFNEQPDESWRHPMERTGEWEDDDTAAVTKLYRSMASKIVEFESYLITKAWKEMEGGRTTIYLEVSAHAADYGKLIGKQPGPRTTPKMLAAWRSIILALSNRMECRIEYEQSREPSFGAGEFHGLPPFKADPNWKPDATVKLLQEIAAALFEKKSLIAFNEDKDQSKTNFTILIQPQDNANATGIESISQALDDIFYSIGKAQGRLIGVKIETRNEDLHDSRNSGRASEVQGG